MKKKTGNIISDHDARQAEIERQKLADEIRAQGSAVDVAAASIRAHTQNPAPPQRPKHPVKDWA